MGDEREKEWLTTTNEAVAKVASTAVSSFQVDDFTVGEAANNLTISLTANFTPLVSAANVTDQQVEIVRSSAEAYQTAIASSGHAPQTEIFKLKQDFDADFAKAQTPGRKAFSVLNYVIGVTKIVTPFNQD